ncbi:MAG: DinB family protein [Gemmataceae bacterium]
MKTLADRFRHWYEYERDCNAKCLAMLESVPSERRKAPEFQKAIDRLVHLMTARQRWLNRLGHWTEPPELFPQGSRLSDLPGMIAATEEAWVQYLRNLDESELAREFEWQFADGKRYRWNVEGALTQVFGHAWYHRGQIAQLVASLGGQAVDSDYIFWSKPQRIDTPPS